jgi:hypothetical protein
MRKARTIKIWKAEDFIKEPQKVFNKSCALCGGKGQVYRGYVEPQIAFQYARDLRPCPRCTQEFLKGANHGKENNQNKNNEKK